MSPSDEIIDTLSFFDSWEDRYRYMIDLGKELPPMDSSLRTEDRIVPGCQSQVWVDHKIDGDKLIFQVDSDALIVKGLLDVFIVVPSPKINPVLPYSTSQFVSK